MSALNLAKKIFPNKIHNLKIKNLMNRLFKSQPLLFMTHSNKVNLLNFQKRSSIGKKMLVKIKKYQMKMKDGFFQKKTKFNEHQLLEIKLKR